jgi:hypothetical protein
MPVHAASIAVLIQMSYYKFDNAYMLGSIAAHRRVFRRGDRRSRRRKWPTRCDLAKKGVRGSSGSGSERRKSTTAKAWPRWHRREAI